MTEPVKRPRVVRPYKVVFLMYAPSDPSMEPAELPIETEAFDAADALLQAGVLAEAQTAIFSSVHGVGVTIKTLRVEPNPPPSPEVEALVLEAMALVAQSCHVEDAARLDAALRLWVHKVRRVS